jgi:hypothetical protein
VFGCLRRAVVLVLILLFVIVAYVFRGRIKQEWREFRGRNDVVVAPSQELADIAFGRIEELRNNEVERVALSQTDLQSLVQYKYLGALPAFASQPNVELDGDHMLLRMRVPVNQLPNVKGLGDVASFLPDTADIELSGTLLPLPGNRIALGVDAVQAAGIPLPERMINEALQRVGRRDETGLPKDAIAVTLPQGVHSAYIRNDSLILLARPRN